MKLSKLIIQDFQSVTHAVIDLADTTLFLGVNGAGKSTIHCALQMAFFGHCEHTDRRGAGYSALIREGAREALIAVEADTHDISLVLTPKARTWECVNTETGEVFTDIKALWPALGINPSHAMMCMFPCEIVQGNELSNILTDYLGDNLSPVTLAEFIPAKHAAYATALASRHHVRLDSVTGYESLGAIAYDRRREVNRELKGAKSRLDELGFVKRVDGDLAAAKAKFTELIGMRARAEAAPVDVAALQDERACLVPLVDKLKAYEEADRAFLQADEVLMAAIHVKNNAESQSNITVCPTCARKLTPYLLEKFNADNAAALAQATEAEAKAREIREAAYRRAAALEIPLETRTAAEVILRLTEIRVMLDNAYDGPTVAAIDAEIAEVAERVQTLERAVERDNLTAQIAKCEADLEHLAHLVRMFHDGEAYRVLLADASTPLLAVVNAHLTTPVMLAADGKRFVIHFDGRPLSHASRGEKAMVAYAFARAFADCGAPVLLDNIDDLSPNNRTQLCKRLRANTSGSVIVSGVPLSEKSDYLDVVAYALAPVAVVNVANGTYTTIAAPVVA